MMTDQHAQPTAAAQRRSAQRSVWLRAFALLLVVAAAGTSAWYWMVSRYSETTDDAYVEGDVVQIAPQIGGTVVAIAVDDGDFVRAGQTLVQLDDADYVVAEQQAEATLASTVRRVRGLFESVSASQAQVDAQRNALARARADFERRRNLAESGAISDEELAHARDALVAAESALAATTAELTRTRALIDGTEVASHPDVQAAAAALSRSYLDRARTTLVAPVDGYVAQRSVQVGGRIAPGTPLMAVVPLERVWVDANFKETQLGRLRIGQPVTLHADLYGDDIAYRGHIASLGVGTGAAFSLLPAENATGNWIKIVQRVPVRVELDPAQLREHPLRIGLSMTATVDLHDTDGAVLPSAPSERAHVTTDVYAGQLADARQLATSIIHDNLPQALRDHE